MVFCTIFTALDLIRVVISFRISVRFLVCWLGGCPVTVSAFRSASSILIRDPKCLPKSLGAPTGAPHFFSTSKFSIADWKGGMGHGFEKFICLLQNHLQRFRCFPPLDKIFETSKLRQEAGAKDLRQVKTR